MKGIGQRLALTAILVGGLWINSALQATAFAQNEGHTVELAWWNVENLFDTQNDSLVHDEDFTPEGNHHWTGRRLNAKLQIIGKTIAMMGMPIAVGLSEVENDYVLHRLCMATPLRMANYGFVHYDSPDRRGIDCALLYRKDYFRPLIDSAICVSDSSKEIYTRDILLVVGVTPSGDTLCLLLNHWPSKLGGDIAEEQRLGIAARLRKTMGEMHGKYPSAAIVAMGDMNCTPEEPTIAEGMGFGHDSLNAEGTINLTLRLPKQWGSHKYQGEWNYLDQIYLLSTPLWACSAIELIRYPHLLTEEQRMPGVKPLRTYIGLRYVGGASDHLPLMLQLKHYPNNTPPSR